ncbi:rhomboid family intramembrane serine protease [Mucilaginibacter terrae]|uniref:Membrane associated rhomboid family serine protease n=1 Tax=Mucilaginibacter terrae TaxID=1955052 RepID=A0ABU3GXL4_9SPHI|nr:rhomboid family intramembrane serine protease [Mucilaginibacter terrae]MDT3403415.1 membrane associated rhomboid family serine protease [Mucilaginibacter terrae]
MEQIFQAAPVASIIFIITIALSLWAFSNERIYGEFMLHPYSVAKGDRVWTLITSGFIHRDWAHLLFNMWSYFIFAPTLEGLIGHWQFALLYFASLILSDLPTVGKYKDHYNYHSLGASGAISAVLFSYILFYPMNRIGVFPIPFGIPAVIFGVLYLAYCVYASKQSRDSINHDAHFFGALSGIMITILLYHDVLSNFIGQISSSF